ncbi:MAG: hypothetical protein ABSB56_08615 [Nitrososphaerales archaeon]
MPVAKHALFWVSVAIGLDYLTSWTMMSFLGPTAEGSVVTRDFFVSRNLGTFAALFESQLSWVVIFGVALAAFLVFRFQPKAFDRHPLSDQKAFLEVASIIAWCFGAYRLMIGPTSNVSAFIASAYGQQVGDNAYELLIAVAAVVVFSDFLWVLFVRPRMTKRKPPEPSTLSASLRS